MATTMTNGGKCPVCGYDKMFMRYGTYGWFKYDACPKCSFAYGEAQGETGLEDYTKDEVWDAVIHFHEPELIHYKFSVNFSGMFQLAEHYGRDEEYEYDSVFIYNDKGERV